MLAAISDPSSWVFVSGKINMIQCEEKVGQAAGHEVQKRQADEMVYWQDSRQCAARGANHEAQNTTVSFHCTFKHIY
ncbi:hypothetical protein DPEC_G00126130 [Dallia pectoralis]|uniref:Uncharacterized protein n=1 Tax=Dallia pectoralis TaxID=75939 RepID=A0ACC2GRI2_DALPE|nr:hypothetical protein DPEC_G00126130 [Dallia pectoralis]